LEAGTEGEQPTSVDRIIAVSATSRIGGFSSQSGVFTEGP